MYDWKVAVSFFIFFNPFHLPVFFIFLIKKIFSNNIVWNIYSLGHNPPHGPIHRGFDHFLGTPMSHDYGCTNMIPWQMECPNRQFDICSSSNIKKADPSTCHVGPNNPWDESIPLYHGDTIIEQPVDLNSLSNRYAAFAIDFIVEKNLANIPFFLYMAFNHMHIPVGNHLPKFKNTSLNRGVYGDSLRQLDDSIGQVIDKIYELGLDNNTLILITGDNGGDSNQCQYGGINSPYNGEWLSDTYDGGGATGKGTTWEGGHREPGLAIWRGKIKPNSKSNVTLSTLDILPTFLNLANITEQLPRDRIYDGVDFSKVLLYNATEIKRAVGGGALYHPNSGCEGIIGELETIRLREFKAKYRTGGQCTSCSGTLAPNVYHDPPLIFNLQKDPSEKFPLNHTNSIHYHSLVKEFKHVLNEMMENVKHDNTTIANYENDKSVKPCCNKENKYCMCN